MVDQLGEGIFLRFFPHLLLHRTAVSRIADTTFAANVDPSPLALNFD
jgi:hypothetical protein